MWKKDVSTLDMMNIGVGVIFNFPLLAGKSAVLIRKMLGLISPPPQIMKIK